MGLAVTSAIGVPCGRDQDLRVRFRSGRLRVGMQRAFVLADEGDLVDQREPERACLGDRAIGGPSVDCYAIASNRGAGTTLTGFAVVGGFARAKSTN